MLIERIATLAGLAVVGLLMASPAGALTMAECSTKYNAAKNAGSLDGKTWNQFRKAECGSDASTAKDDAKPAKKTKAKTAAASDDEASGLSMSECSARYQAAKSADALNGMKWNAFRKAECGPGASDDDTVPSIDEAKYDGEPAAPRVKAPRGVKFPTAVSRKYSNESAGRARMHTCLDQYYANKDAGSLGELRWIQKGGGFYSLCNSRLKGNS